MTASRAIGAWAGLTAVAAAIGPPVGGYLTDAVSWRAVFLVNLPLGVFVIIAAGFSGCQKPGIPPVLVALICAAPRSPCWPSPARASR